MILERPPLYPLLARLQEPRRFLQVVAGPRQMGKTTLVWQALALQQASPAGTGMAQRDVRVVILGSAPLLIARGLTESMAGRFEITRLVQLDDAGNTTTLAHYLDLLEGTGMVCGLPK